MVFRVLLGVALVVFVGLAFASFEQARRIDRLDAELSKLRAQVDGLDLTATAVPAAAPQYVPPPPRPASSAPAPAEVPAAPRVPVTRDEVARVESAVLDLLDSDRPELRAKLRAVVQEQQQTLEQERRDQRRERWAARLEARLLEVGEQAGIGAEQRQAIAMILLSTRDQVTDMRQSAESPEAIAQVRDKVRALREQADAQVKALLEPAQYEAYRARFADDDDDERRPRRPDRAERRGSQRAPAAPPP